MKKHKYRNANPKQLKAKLMATLAMLLVASILLTTTSYAWLVLSVSPEVTGVSTNIGSNGSLEIALLNTETRQDMSGIKTTIGDSLANRSANANNTWGNLIDLSDKGYGLSNIMLLPARLNAVAKSGEEGYVVDSGLLSIPTYGFDGRIIELTDDTISAVYKNAEFSYTPSAQDYGVRAIGTSDSLTVQGSALALARSNIKTYTNSAKNSVVAGFDAHGSALFDIVLAHSSDANATYNDNALDGLKGLIKELQNALDYIDLALRQGMVAYAASVIVDEDMFTQAKDQILDTTNELSGLIESMEEKAPLPSTFSEWVEKLEDAQNDLNASSNAANALTDGSYTWTEISGVMKYIMNIEKVYINDTLVSDLTVDDAMGLLGKDITLTLAPGSGVPADVADFTDDYSTWITTAVGSVQIATATTVETPYLLALLAAANTLEAADSGAGSDTAVALTATYGYALDMAFRCNAAESDLLLQTTPEQRVYSDSTSASTMGGGSYMEFTSADESFTLGDIITLMDAVRVGFLDDQGNLLGVAKLNTSNRSTEDRMVTAPLYLYAYSFSEEDGSMVMGERQKTNNVITSLERNIAKAITVVVWLDGDVVDNSMVSATESASLSGMLNLQFASSAELIPASNSELLNLTVDKTGLATAVLAGTELVSKGQGLYTTLSWDKFTDAYAYAMAVNDNDSATDSQIYNATLSLAQAQTALTLVSHDALSEKIDEIREIMGETTDLARYVVETSEGVYEAIDPYTEEQKDNRVGEIYRVDYAKNLHDEGNDVKTAIYTDESWTALAAALYDAEAVDMNANAVDAALDAALSALDVAYNALQRKVFYLPYDYNGVIYYFAISEETDTYGKWYDKEFKRIVADKTILDLDAHAERINIAEIEQFGYISNAYDCLIEPYINILDEIYPSLAIEEILAIQWKMDGDLYVEAMNQSQITRLYELKAQAEALGLDTTAATAILEKTGTDRDTEKAADEAIAALEKAIAEANTAEEPSEEPTVVYMTADQRTLLMKAVSSANNVENHAGQEEKEKLEQAVADAEAVLSAEEGTVTYEEAENKLAALNAALVVNGENEVTAYNSLTYTIPVGSELYEVVHEVESENALLYLTGKTGTTTMTAVILTRNGIVNTITKNVTVYIPAEDAEIDLEMEEAPVGGAIVQTENSYGEEISVWNRNIQAGEMVDITASLLDRVGTADLPVLNEEGSETIGRVTHGEEIKAFTWASGDTEVLTITGKNSSICTINAVAAGVTTVTVSVETVQGNIYTDVIYVTVKAVP